MTGRLAESATLFCGAAVDMDSLEKQVSWYKIGISVTVAVLNRTSYFGCRIELESQDLNMELSLEVLAGAIFFKIFHIKSCNDIKYNDSHNAVICYYISMTSNSLSLEVGFGTENVINLKSNF
jgi:hypothetical protein